VDASRLVNFFGSATCSMTIAYDGPSRTVYWSECAGVSGARSETYDDSAFPVTSVYSGYRTTRVVKETFRVWK
jgi:hypothetical protein